MTILRVYALAAVSTPEQAKSQRESIPAQKREFSQAANDHGWQIIKVLEVPGFSRDYIDFSEARDDMLRAKEPITAFAELEHLWKTRTIDLLLVRDGDRFARSQPIYSTIVWRLIKAGARLFYTAKGLMVDEKNYIPVTAFGGYQAADEIARLKARHEMGMNGRYQRGLSGHKRPFSHILVGSKDNQRLELDRSKDRFWLDLKELLIGGASINKLSELMAQRGHVRPNGKPYTSAVLWEILHNPFIWGHVARNFEPGTWAYDDTIPLPPGVEMQSNRIEPVWKGEDAAIIKGILKYRSTIGSGNHRQEPHRLTGLLICDHCGYNLVFRINSYATPAYHCMTPWARPNLGCPNRKQIREDVAIEQISEFLEMRNEKISELFADSMTMNATSRIADIQGQLTELRRQMELAAQNELSAPEEARYIYSDQVRQKARQIRDLNIEVQRLATLQESPDTKHQRQVAFQAITVSDFFDQPAPYVNQYMHLFAGKHRFAVKSGEIVDFRRGPK